MRVAVIGAGPSGLVTLKYLLQCHLYHPISPIEARLFEAERTIGGTFAHRTYEDAELVSSKQLTSFSDFRPRGGDPDFISVTRYLEYLAEFCSKFNLWPSIRLQTTVESTCRRPGGGHTVVYRSDDGTNGQWDCDAIAVCTGLHVVPNIPTVKGIDYVPTVLHSSTFKLKSQFGVGKTVLILGTGETGMDVAHMAVTSPTERVILCHRDGFLCAPKRVPDPIILPIFWGKPDLSRPNVPVDSSSASLFDTAYVHPILRNNLLLWEYYDLFIKSTLWLVSGTKHGLDRWIGGISEQRYHASKIFFNKSNKAMPYISAQWREPAASSWIQRIRSSIIQVPIADTRGRRIDLAPWPSYIDSGGIVHFTNNGRPEYDRIKGVRVKPDVLIFATGYVQAFPFLGEGYPTAADADVREIWKRDDPSIGFIGFVRPSFGAIPPLSELQAQLWVLNLVASSRVPKLQPRDEPHYRLLTPPGSRIRYGVDHESYAYQLALDMDAAPGIKEVIEAGWRGCTPGSWYKLPLVWALGANFNAKFRLRGPWRLAEAEAILSGELWDTIKRRGGFFGHITLSGVPILVFGTISCILYLYVEVASLLRRAIFGSSKSRYD